MIFGLVENDQPALFLNIGDFMNERQKKKFLKKNMTKLRKIHPTEGDIIVFQWNPDSEYTYFDTVIQFYKAWERAGIFDKCNAAIVPCNVKVLDKESAQKFCDNLQEKINSMK